MRKLNLVFQGGGVKGIAYAGVLQSLPKECKVVGVGGTSAGALVAALIAIGKRGTALHAILKDPKLFSLLEATQAERYARLKDLLIKRHRDWKLALDDLNTIWAEYKAGYPGVKQIRLVSRLSKFRGKHDDLLSKLPTIWQDIRDCWQKKGLHSSLPLREWLDRVLENKKFADIKDIDLRIVATDVSHHSYSIFVASEHKGESIAHAVHASVSIPLFFEPLIVGTEYLVDGGLLSNFPNFLFAQSPFPTVGFQLTENVEAADCSTTLGYLTHLLGTMVAAHDKQRKTPPHFRSYAIETPNYIPFDKFNLETRDVDELFYRGAAQGGSINWVDAKHSSEDELVVYFDPKPDDVLHQALIQATLLVEEHLLEENWVGELRQKTTLRVRIDDDWSSRYDRLDEMQVFGQGALFLQRQTIMVSPAVGRFRSLADTDPKCFEEIGAERKPLVFIPLFNREDGKGFAMFYSPPLQEGQVPRKFRRSMRIPQEFASVDEGSKGEISLSLTKRAKSHRIGLSIELLTHNSLPELKFSPNFSSDPPQEAVERIGGRRYDRKVWTLPEGGHENFHFPLKLEFRRSAGLDVPGKDD